MGLFDKLKNDQLKVQRKKLIADIEKLLALKQKAKEGIYHKVRKQKQKSNQLITLKGAEIDLSGENSLISKIPILNTFSKSKKFNPDYTVFYFGYGNIAKLINISEVSNKTLNLTDTKELYNLIDYNENKENLTDTEKPFFLNGKRLIWINEDIIFNPKLNVTDKEFIYDLSPKYYYGVINEVMDWNLTKPKTEPMNFGTALRKYWLYILILGGIYLLSQSADKTP